MHAPMNPNIRRVGQLLRLMLSSDQAGEVTAAKEALNRALQSAGLDFHVVANIVEAGLQRQLPIEQPRSEFRPRPPAKPSRQPRRPDGQPLSMDQRIICDQPSGIFRRCSYCAGVHFTVMPGAGPHVAQLVCDDCKRGGRWLSRQHFGATS
jgi:hypothetical protein